VNIKETIKIIFSSATLIGLAFFSISIVLAELDDPTTREGGLTDQEYLLSKEYKNQGLINRKTKELCKGNEDTCIGEKDSGDKVLGLNPGMIEAVAQAYALIVGTVGGDFTAAPEKGAKDGATEVAADSEIDAEKIDEKEKTKPDYCKYIATATETISTFKQSEEQKMIQSTPLNRQRSYQKEQLYKAARTHKARAGTAKIQTYGWGATTACYGYMMAAGGIVTDWKVIAKTAAAGFLTVFYNKQQGRYADQASKVKEIAEAIPGKGDCNPITERQCYCMQPEAEGDRQYCLPSLRPEQPFTANTERTTCVDKNLKQDPQCKCTLTNTCFNQTFYSEIGAGNFGSNFQQNVLKPINSISTGSISGGNLSTSSLNKLAASAKKTLGQFKKEINLIPQIKSNGRSKATELALTNSGIPANIARRIAQTPPSAASKSILASLKSGVANASNYSRDKSPSSGKVLYFGGKKKTRAQRKKSNEFDFLNKLRKKKKKKRHASNIINFANKAQQNAQISKKGKSIFQLISRRYKVSAERRLK